MNKTLQKNFFYILVILASIFILPKWFIGAKYFELDIITNLIINFIDTQYLPIILSFSDLNFSPTYLEDIKGEGPIGFPILPLLIHSIVFKFFGPHSIIILNLILKLVLFYVIFKFFEKVFNSKIESLIFCVLSFFFFCVISYLHFIYHLEIVSNIYGLFKNFIAHKIPRPSITSIFFFLNIYLLLFFKEKIKHKISYKFLFIFALSLAMLINTHFFSFIILSPLLIVILFLEKKFKKLNFLKENFLKILFFLFFLILFSFPFLIQLFFSNIDYNIRIGLIELGIEQKKNFISYYLNKLLNIKLIFIFASSFLIHLYFNKKYKNIYNLDIFFYLIISSIFAPVIFVLFSPKIINISHFVSYIYFSIFMFFSSYLFLFVINLIKKIKKLQYLLKEKIFIKLYFIIFCSFFLIFYENLIKLENNQYLKDLNKIQSYLKKNNIENTKLKLFTNHLIIQNLWLLNGNTNLLISDAFTNVLSKNNIDFLLTNSLKSFGISNSNFKKYLLEKKVMSRDKLMLFISNYRYQANQLFHYDLKNNYNLESIQKINKSSPFNNQLTILSENEKQYFINKYENHQIDKKKIPDFAIIEINDFNKNLKLNNLNYVNDLVVENFIILRLKQDK